ncbi:MAG: hypothetical protein ACXVY8_00265 [Gaiellaceae bacterium]
MQLFHYHLVSSKARELEARYLARLGFDLIARYGRVGEETTSYESGFSWDRLDSLGFKLRLSELERGGVNVVIQPGQWELPRVDHFGLALDEDEFVAAIARAERIGLRLQEHGGRRTFVSTRGAFRLELHPPRDWLDELLAGAEEFRISELQLLADNPEIKAQGFAEVLDLHSDDGTVELDDLLIRFLPGGPQGRPQLEAERFTYE